MESKRFCELIPGSCDNLAGDGKCGISTIEGLLGCSRARVQLIAIAIKVTEKNKRPLSFFSRPTSLSLRRFSNGVNTASVTSGILKDNS